jgi:uncharacterized protein YjbI with pentapeptide repeats
VDADELAMRERELAAQRRATTWTTIVASMSFFVSAITVAASVFFSIRTLNQSTSQFRQNLQESAAESRQSSRDTQYNTIVTGLSSDAAAVQDNSMWLLREFVDDPSNYSGKSAQQQGARDTIQTLSAFIEDNSFTKDHSGLSYYESPQPIILSKAMVQLKALDGDATLGSHDADVSRGNFHGISLPYFAPKGSFLAVNTDFRRAILHHLNLSAQPADLAGSFFTCANLKDANFGAANLTNADLTGADLSGADLSKVQKQTLTAAQLHGVTISPTTKLPPQVSIDVTGSPQWGADSRKCAQLVDRMTGMEGGQGYSSAHPCPTNPQAAARLHTDPPFDGTLTDLVTACKMRQS